MRCVVGRKARLTRIPIPWMKKIDRSRIHFGLTTQENTEIIVYPPHENVFASPDLYMAENSVIDENSGEPVLCARIIPVLTVPLSVVTPDWSGPAYFLYQEELAADSIEYTLDKEGRIATLQANEDYRLDADELGGMSLPELRVHLDGLRNCYGRGIRLLEDRFDITPPLDRSAYQTEYDYDAAYREWQSCFQAHRFPTRHPAPPTGKFTMSLGNYPVWIQAGCHFLEDSSGSPMEYVGHVYYFHLGLSGMRSYLFYAPTSGEFLQIDQIT